jgi:hypothetical protein
MFRSQGAPIHQSGHDHRLWQPQRGGYRRYMDFREIYISRLREKPDIRAWFEQIGSHANYLKRARVDPCDSLVCNRTCFSTNINLTGEL